MSDEKIKYQEFETLFRRGYTRLYCYALDYVEDEEVAKDIVIELFSDLWVQYDGWHPDNPEAYLNRALRNRCLNYLKHLSVEQKALQRYIEDKAENIDPDTSIQEERMKLVEKVMEGLAPRIRFILEQCYVEGRTYSEIASMLDTSVGMIHKHISKALAFFRETLGEKGTKKGTKKGDGLSNR